MEKEDSYSYNYKRGRDSRCANPNQDAAGQSASAVTVTSMYIYATGDPDSSFPFLFSLVSFVLRCDRQLIVVSAASVLYLRDRTSSVILINGLRVLQGRRRLTNSYIYNIHSRQYSLIDSFKHLFMTTYMIYCFT